MTRERWQQIVQVYQAALDHDVTQRAAFLSHACAGDAELRREVESLIASHEQVGSFFAEPALKVAAKTLVGDQAASMVGLRLSRYRIKSLLGVGGMGEVYLAEDTGLGRKVALKLLPEYFTKDAERVRRFEQEARAASALNHPNIITIYDIGKSGGRHFIATEYVEGETLRQRLARGRIGVKEVLNVTVQVASGLAAAHKAGIVHRDIKPENIIIRQDGYVKVLDFGLAKLIEEPVSNDTQAPTQILARTDPGTIMGTASYMSPEQARGERVSHRSDVFSLGVVTYEMMTGQLPFIGRSPAEAISAMINDPHRPVAELNPEVPAVLSAAVDRALAKNAEERYQSVDEMVGALTLTDGRADVLLDPFRTSGATPRATARHFSIGLTPSRRGSLVAATILTLAIAVVAYFYFYPTFRTASTQATSPPNEFDYNGLMRLIPAGEFVMGSDNYEDDEKPAHSVFLSAYYIDKFEVTNKQYREFCDSTGRSYPKRPGPGSFPDYFVSEPNFPAMWIQFKDAVEYANFVGKRLPTEEEWEKAASWNPDTQSKHIWPWGDTPTPGRANIDSDYPVAVGHYQNDRSAYGVHDMGGNVIEYVDGFYESYDPTRSLGVERIQGILVRGGMFKSSLLEARTTFRNHIPKSFPSGMALPIGFRCAVSENDPKLREYLSSHTKR